MKNYNLNNCLDVYKDVKSLDECFNSKSPSFGMIIREKGNDFTEAFLSAWLVNLNEILNLKRPMTEGQIVLCSKEILENYSNLKIIDITFLFRRIMSGEFGEFYESLSIPKVLTFFRNYYEERALRAGKLSRMDSDEHKQDPTFNISKNPKRNWYGTPRE